MSAIQAGSVQAALQAERDRFDLAVKRLAKKFRTDVLVPFCRKHRLRFISGNGTYFFLQRGRIERDIINTDDAPTVRLREALGPIFEALDAEVGRDDPFGLYVDDIGAS